MLEKLSREQILELYLALRCDYFDVTIELIEQERAKQQAFALVELMQIRERKCHGNGKAVPSSSVCVCDGKE